MKEKKLVVFDLDGTLNKTDLYSVPAHQKALAELGIFDKTKELIISTFGERSEDCIHLLINSHDKTLAHDYRKKVSKYEAELIANNCAFYDGVDLMLEKLQADGYYTAVCSNASERYIKLVLNSINIMDKINYIQHLVPNMIKDETLRLLIEREAPFKTVMVGDRKFDKIAAASNSIPFIGCLYGFMPCEVADADIAVNSPSEINEAVSRLI